MTEKPMNKLKRCPLCGGKETMSRTERLIKNGYLIFQFGKIKIFGLYSKNAKSKIKKILHYFPVLVIAK